MNDLKLVKYLLVLLLLPVALAMCSGDKFRYPCQDPANWEKDICKKPLCDVTRTCPEHIFKGQRDPRQGMPNENTQTTIQSTTQLCQPNVTQGASCAK